METVNYVKRISNQFSYELGFVNRAALQQAIANIELKYIPAAENFLRIFSGNGDRHCYFDR